MAADIGGHGKSLNLAGNRDFWAPNRTQRKNPRLRGGGRSLQRTILRIENREKYREIAHSSVFLSDKNGRNALSKPELSARGQILQIFGTGNRRDSNMPKRSNVPISVRGVGGMPMLRKKFEQLRTISQEENLIMSSTGVITNRSFAFFLARSCLCNSVRVGFQIHHEGFF
jgi:hypothetical protein